jgi:hypothetical protein
MLVGSGCESRNYDFMEDICGLQCWRSDNSAEEHNQLDTRRYVMYMACGPRRVWLSGLRARANDVQLHPAIVSFELGIRLQIKQQLTWAVKRVLCVLVRQFLIVERSRGAPRACLSLL